MSGNTTVVETEHSIFVLTDDTYCRYLKGAVSIAQQVEMVFSGRLNHATRYPLRSFQLPCVCDYASWQHLHLFHETSAGGIFTSAILDAYTVLADTYYG